MIYLRYLAFMRLAIIFDIFLRGKINLCTFTRDNSQKQHINLFHVRMKARHLIISGVIFNSASYIRTKIYYTVHTHTCKVINILYLFR